VGDPPKKGRSLSEKFAATLDKGPPKSGSLLGGTPYSGKEPNKQGEKIFKKQNGDKQSSTTMQPRKGQRSWG